MKKYKLKNGLTVILVKKPSNSVAFMVTVKVGSNYESSNVSGISHFIEHMVFEGTKNRPTGCAVANEIESIGGDINAYTSNERTSFYVRVLDKHFSRGLDVISDILQNPLFDPTILEKERKVVLKEIDMVTDEPRFHQWVLFHQALFKKHPTKNPAYGTIKAVSSMNRSDLVDYYSKFYRPNNMVLTVVGNVPTDALKLIEKAFSVFDRGTIPHLKKVKEPAQTKVIKKEKRKTLGSYMVLGYKTTPRLHKDSYILDVIRAILGRGQSGRIFDEIRGKRGLAYDVGVHYDSSTDYGYLAVHVNTDKKNIPKCVELILNELDKLKSISDKELSEAKEFLEGEFYLQNEDNFQFADTLGFWELISDVKLIDSYISQIKKVTRADIARVVTKYFGKKYAMAVIEQK